MEANDWIQLVLGIATLLTAGTALANVYILKKQRRDSQKPILQLEDTYFADASGSIILPENIVIENNGLQIFNFSMVNSGYGVANNISVHCYYDLSSLIKGFDAEQFVGFDGSGILFHDSGEKLYSEDFFTWSTINYILPYKTNEKASFSLDIVYEGFLHRIRKLAEKDMEYYKLLSSCTLFANLQYFDSIQNKYNDYYQISIEFSAVKDLIVFGATRISRKLYRQKKRQYLSTLKVL
jgi:hypothetical protein